MPLTRPFKFTNPYFSINTSIYKPSSSLNNHQSHFPTKALLKSSNFLSPTHPSLLEHTLHSILPEPLYFPHPFFPHKKFLWILFRISMTFLGAIKKNRKYREKEEIIDCTKLILPQRIGVSSSKVIIFFSS